MNFLTQSLTTAANGTATPPVVAPEAPLASDDASIASTVQQKTTQSVSFNALRPSTAPPPSAEEAIEPPSIKKGDWKLFSRLTARVNEEWQVEGTLWFLASTSRILFIIDTDVLPVELPGPGDGSSLSKKLSLSRSKSRSFGVGEHSNASSGDEGGSKLSKFVKKVFGGSGKDEDSDGNALSRTVSRKSASGGAPVSRTRTTPFPTIEGRSITGFTIPARSIQKVYHDKNDRDKTTPSASVELELDDPKVSRVVFIFKEFLLLNEAEDLKQGLDHILKNGTTAA